MNSTAKQDNVTHMGRTEFELDLTHRENKDFTLEITTISSITSIDQDTDSKNELGLDKKDKKETAPTDAPFELDLTSHNNAAESPTELKEKPSNTTAVNIPSDQDNMHFRRPKDDDLDDIKKESMPRGMTDEVVNMDEKNTTAGELWVCNTVAPHYKERACL